MVITFESPIIRVMRLNEFSCVRACVCVCVSFSIETGDIFRVSQAILPSREPMGPIGAFFSSKCLWIKSPFLSS